MHARKRMLLLAIGVLPSVIAGCSEAATAVSSSRPVGPARQSLAYPRLTAPAGDILEGAAAREANWVDARRHAANGDSAQLLQLVRYESSVNALAAERINRPTASFDGAGVTVQTARIYGSGTVPSAIGGYLQEYLDYEGDQQLSRAQYKITDLNGLLGDWANVADNDNPGTLHYSSLSECNSTAACMWRHQETRYTISMPSCGKDLM